LPTSYAGATHLVADAAHRRIFYTGWSGPGGDTVSFGALALDDGTHTVWHARPAGNGRVILGEGDDALFLIEEGGDNWSVFSADGPGRITRIGRVPKPVNTLSISRDRRRVVANVRDYRADAWMSKVIRP
jgi:hypothetical protein